jgi:ElaB/YqjD/DUF883 family membrane-anchored ribosome-binding protein
MTINDQMSNSADTMAQKTSPARERMNTMASNAMDKAANVKDQAAEWLSEHGDQLSATQKRLIDNTTSYVSANPLKSVGIAVLAALVVGRLMR